MTDLGRLLEQTPYVAYSYAYPHKTAYRVLEPPIGLREAWAMERRDALFLYLHVPFCEMRCGFCNLFTTLDPQHELPDLYLAALERQAEQTLAALDGARFARLAIGGGTPTFLSAGQLTRLFDLVEGRFGLDLRTVPISVETSPKTAEAAKLAVLRERGVDRISIGVQSFVAAEAAAAGRAQQTPVVEAALDRIREFGFATLNIDLIYGLPGQTVATWLESLATALRFAPEELYLYPLYVRPLTGLGRRDDAWDDIRLACYRAGREFLLAQGYTQVSMRMFRAAHAPVQAGPVYCCQEDGMVGLGCGARSYTSSLHYSSEYAVGASGVRAILSDYLRRSGESFDVINYGVVLPKDDQQRRYLIQSLLQADGLEAVAYRARFGTDLEHDWPELGALVTHGLAEHTPTGLRLTPLGLERSDMIGPWLYSSMMHQRMSEFELR